MKYSLLPLLFVCGFLWTSAQTDSLQAKRDIQTKEFWEEQPLKLGIKTGVNFASINGDLNAGKWEPQAGPSTELFVNYRLSDYFSFQTGLFYHDLYYYHQDLRFASVEYAHRIEPYWSSGETKQFCFYGIPLELHFNTQTKIRMQLSAGIAFSFLDNSRESYSYVRPPYLDSGYERNSRSNDNIEDIPQHDVGYLFSGGISYPISGDFDIGLTGSFYKGKREFMDTYKGKLEAFEMMMKLGFSGLVKKQRKQPKNPSTENNITMTLKGGALMSRHRGSKHQNSYNTAFAFAPGFSLDFPISENTSFHTGFHFERKGYQMEASSQNVFRMVPSQTEGMNYSTDTRIAMDYLTVPFYLKFGFGKPLSVYLTGGFYYGYNVSARSVGKQIVEDRLLDNYKKTKESVYDHIEGYVTNSDWGWLTGLGMEWPVYGRYKLDLELRYDQSFENVFKSFGPATSIYNDNHLFHESFRLMVGWQIPINSYETVQE